jgi:hypothetical protein
MHKLLLKVAKACLGATNIYIAQGKKKKSTQESDGEFLEGRELFLPSKCEARLRRAQHILKTRSGRQGMPWRPLIRTLNHDKNLIRT